MWLVFQNLYACCVGFPLGTQHPWPWLTVPVRSRRELKEMHLFSDQPVWLLFLWVLGCVNMPVSGAWSKWRFLKVYMHWYTEMKVSESIHALVYRNEGFWKCTYIGIQKWRRTLGTVSGKRLSRSEMKFIKTAGYRSY